MIRICTIFTSLIITIVVCIPTSLHPTACASPESAYQSSQKLPPLTLKQIEDLIRNRTPDEAIATEIKRRTISFQVNKDLIERLRREGAGAKTLQALTPKSGATPADISGAGTPESKIIILVADFYSADGQSRTFNDLINEELRNATSDYPDVEIRSLGETITPQQGRDRVRAVGKEHNASVVLWGWLTKTQEKVLVTAHFEVLDSIGDFPIETGRQMFTAGLPELEEFSVQFRLSSELTFLALSTMGFARLEVDDYAGAIARFSDALDQQSVPDQIVDLTDIYLARGTAYMFQASLAHADTLEKAIADFDQSIKLDNTNGVAFMMRANAYILKGDRDKAIADAKKMLEGGLNDRGKIVAYNLIGTIYLLKDDAAQAKGYFEKAIKASEGSSIEGIYLVQAQAYLFTDNLTQALVTIDKALQQNLKGQYLVNAHLTKGSIYLKQDNYDGAISELNEVIRLAPKYALAYAIRAEAFDGKEDYDRAIQDYSVYIEDTPPSMGFITPEIYNERGLAYYYKDANDKAIADYNKAIELNPKLAEAYYNRGNAYLNDGQLDKSLDDFNTELQLQPDEPDGLLKRAKVYSLKNRYDEAIADYDRLIKLNPNNAKAFFERGVVYDYKGSLDRAFADYNRALTINPNYASAYLYRGKFYAKKGNREDAMSDFNKVLQLTKNPSLRREAQQQLDLLAVSR